MEKEKLIIKNFGPIKSVELDLGRFNILIGEQATGKSTVAKVLAVCRYFSYIVSVNSLDDHIDGPFYKGLQAWGLTESLQTDSYIFYECDNYRLTVKETFVKLHESTSNGFDDNDKIQLTDKIVDYSAYLPKVFPLSDEFANLINVVRLTGPNKSNPLRTIPISFFQNEVAQIISNPFYISVERGLQSIFSLGKSSIANLSDALFNQFARIDGIARQFKNDTFIEPLNLYYQNRNGHGFIRKANEEKYYSLFNAASGYQSIIPIVLAIKYYNEIKRKNKTFFIEEPEISLFPIAQNKLMQYLVEKAVNDGNNMLLTTHSPYTLTSLNNLMYAYQVGQKYPGKVTQEIDKKYWINPDDVSAYMMKSDGTCEDIFDREEGLIKAEKIDSASEIINDVFDKMLHIEIGK